MATSDKEFTEYAASTHQLWIPSKYSVAWTDELVLELYNNGFLVDNVLCCFNSSVVVEWHGRCYDENDVTYRFIAKWVLNPTKFTYSVVHYYDLEELTVRPEERSDDGRAITRTEEQVANDTVLDRNSVGRRQPSKRR